MSFSNRAQAPTQKPNPVAILASIVHSYRSQGILGYQMPNDNNGAAKWFMGRMEPQQRYEGMTLESTVRGDGEYWKFPYLDRMKYLLKKYMELPDGDQAVIIGCCEEGVFWRGETLKHFYEAETSVYNEIMRMREIGASEYQKQTVALMAKLDFGGNGQKESPEEDSEPCIEL